MASIVPFWRYLWRDCSPPLVAFVVSKSWNNESLLIWLVKGSAFSKDIRDTFNRKEYITSHITAEYFFYCFSSEIKGILGIYEVEKKKLFKKTKRFFKRQFLLFIYSIRNKCY